MQSLKWKLGFTPSPDQQPDVFFDASVPGAVQADYARAHEWPPFWQGLNFRDYKWMEDVYWLYTAELNFTLAADEIARLCFKGIDYRYRISVDGEVLIEDEGMFAPVFCDVTRFAGAVHTLEVLIFPAPKEGRTDDRNEARKSCKAAACYGWDWHPRLVTLGLWDDAGLIIQPRRGIRALEASYVLNDALNLCTLTVQAEAEGMVRVSLLDHGCVCAQAVQAASSPMVLSVENPKLWNPVGYGDQAMYELRAEALDEQDGVLDTCTRRIGFRRSRMLMNEGSWKEPSQFPKSRSDAPATLELNGRRIFAKGSNWVNAQVFPGEMTEAHYRDLLTLVKNANMNILRIWGGGFVNKESFFDLCDEMGIMVWQEFPLACNEYPDDPAYLAVLEKEARAIVRRLRTHPCVVLWCGGNELFNSWSKMTDQHHALRLLDSVCYAEDRFTPYIMTSPLNGMAHGHYRNYETRTGVETIAMFRNARNTAYTEFGAPGGSSPEYIRQFMSEEDFQNCSADNELWREHHAFSAWQQDSWLRVSEVEYYFGGHESVEDLCLKTQFIQGMCYRSYFEEMRKQWPHCSMALNWCLNEPWPSAANNNLISWPAEPKPAYEQVRLALRDRLASLRVDRHLWWAGETFHADVWLMNDSSPIALEPGSVTVYYALGDAPEVEWGCLRTPEMAAQQNRELGVLSFPIPADFSGKLHIRLSVENHPEMDSCYTYPCRKKAANHQRVILNM